MVVLQCKYDLKIGLPRVRRLFKSMNLPKISSRKIPTQSIKSTSSDFHNLLNCRFNPDVSNRIWVSDITYLKVGSKWHYLCVVIDLFSRKVISCIISDQPNAQLVINTFKKAYKSSNCLQGLLFHSDCGFRYSSVAFRKRLDEFNIVQSFSDKGCVPSIKCRRRSFFQIPQSRRNESQILF